MKLVMILVLLVLLTALSDAKKKGKKKSHKKKTTKVAESQNTEQKSTIFPKPNKWKVGGGVPDETTISSTPGLSTSTSLTKEGPIRLTGPTGSTAYVTTTGSVTSVGSSMSTASVALMGSTASVGSTASIGSTVSTPPVTLTVSTASAGLTGSTASITLTGSTASVGSVLSGVTTGPTILGPGGSTVPGSLLHTQARSLNTTGIPKMANVSTTIKNTVNQNKTETQTQQSKSSNVTGTYLDVDIPDDDGTENEESVTINGKADDEMSFIREFRLSTDESDISKEHDDDEVFVTEPMPEYKRKKRHSRISNANSHKKRSNNIIEEENLETTISGFKFTGSKSQSSDTAVYKNINT